MNENLEAPARKTIQVKRGNVIVKVYPLKNRVGDAVYTQYAVVSYEGTRRKVKRFADLVEAKAEAELIASKLASGEGDVLRLTSADRTVYLQSLDLLRPLKLPLNVAVLEYVSAVTGLPDGATLKECVEFYCRRNPATGQRRTVRQVVDELVAAKRSANLSAVYVNHLESRLGRFASDFQTSIGSLSTALIQTWLDGLKRSGRTKRNYLSAIGTLFRFAAGRKYLPKDAIDEVLAVQRAKSDNGEIEIFTPTELSLILTAARPELVPWFAIAAFAGLRTSELQRLDWSNVNLAERFIEVPAAKSKTQSRRLAPLTDNLAQWLAPYARASGRVSHFDNMAKQIAWLVQDAHAVLAKQAEESGRSQTTPKFEWKRNALRHSFISYRVAAIKDVAQVALEAGNSPQMIFQHYRQLVTEAETAKWFAVLPDAPANILPLAGSAVP